MHKEKRHIIWFIIFTWAMRALSLGGGPKLLSVQTGQTTWTTEESCTSLENNPNGEVQLQLVERALPKQ
jgi:hypothetical protein